jgi:hypothetical protein
MTSIELKPGDRVRLNELGASRSPKIKVRTGTVIALSSHKSRSVSLSICLMATNDRLKSISLTWSSMTPRQKADEVLALASKRSCTNRPTGVFSGSNCFPYFGFDLHLYAITIG